MNHLMKISYTIIIALFYLSITYPQVNIGQWKALTSPLKSKDIAIVDQTIYSATEGGLFVFNGTDYTTLTTIEGLSGVNLSSLAIDLDSNLWIGGSSPNGFLQVYNPVNKQSVNIFDFGLTEILDIQVLGNYSWVLYKNGQDIGLMKFIYDEIWEYRDSFKNFPIDGGLINCFTATDSTIYIGMDTGLYFSQISGNMKDPNNWIPLTSDFNSSIISLAVDNHFITYSTNSAVYQYDILSQENNSISFSYDFNNIENIFIVSDGYMIADGNSLFHKKNNSDFLIQNKYKINNLQESNGEIFASTNFGLLIISDDYTLTRILPNAPVTNSFSAIKVLKDGRLVAGSSEGLSIYSELGWRNILEIKISNSEKININYNYNIFISDTINYDFGEYIADIEEGPDGLVYCAIRGSRVYQSNPPRWSGGIIVIDIDNPSNVSVIDTTFLSYHTSSNNSIPYQVTLDIEFDSNGNMWVANPYCINGNEPIHVRSVNGVWKHFGSSETSTRISQSPISIEFDYWDRVWVSSFQAEEANLGIYPNGGISLLDYNGLPYNPTLFNWNVIKYDETVWSLGMGLNNRLYYLTPSGLKYFDLKSGNSPVLRENQYPFYPNISFGSGSGIKVDPQGNVWTYSASQGIHVLLENTSYWPDINGLRKNNSLLLSDEIRDIDFDSKNNLAYIATSQGISILRIPFGEEVNNNNNLKVFPSPFHIPSDNLMRVDGLLFNSSMMVMTLDGKVIKNIKARGLSIDGDQLAWDGRDEAGDYVSSGVYLLSIYGKDGSNRITKITVIKK